MASLEQLASEILQDVNKRAVVAWLARVTDQWSTPSRANACLPPASIRPIELDQSQTLGLVQFYDHTVLETWKMTELGKLAIEMYSIERKLLMG